MSQLTPNGRLINWSNVGFTPAGGTLVPINGVQSLKFDAGGQMVKASGDAEYYDTTVEKVSGQPTASLSTNKPGCLAAIPDGAHGTLTATWFDATNKGAAGGGGLLYTFISVYDNGSRSGSHRAVGMGDAQFHGFSPDGATNPLSVSPL